MLEKNFQLSEKSKQKSVLELIQDQSKSNVTIKKDKEAAGQILQGVSLSVVILENKLMEEKQRWKNSYKNEEKKS